MDYLEVVYIDDLGILELVMHCIRFGNMTDLVKKDLEWAIGQWHIKWIV